VPQEPLIYRLYAVVGVYGATLKEVVQKSSAMASSARFDFTMDVNKKADLIEGCVILTLNHKFLPYKAW